jgi:hypothetical protein
MARTPVNNIKTLSAIQSCSVQAQAADFTFAACDHVNGNVLTITGKELLLVKNNGGSPATITITAKTDIYGRGGSIASYSVGASKTSIFGPFAVEAWAQSAAGDLFIDGSAADIQLFVIRFP